MYVIEKTRKGWQRWHLFKEIEPDHQPGQRFQTPYNNHRQRRERGETWKCGRVLNSVGGLGLVVAGFALVPTPGLSYVNIVIGMWMLAIEFLPLTRFFDRVEVSLGELGRWTRSLWIKSSVVARALIVLTILLCIAALGYWLIT
jgi:hypothetical protein